MNVHYLIAGIIRRYIPERVLFAIMDQRGDGSTGEHDPDAYFRNVWRSRLAEPANNIAGKHIIDVGSGRYARFALRLLANGAARVTLIDFYATSLQDPEHRAILIDDCKNLGLDPADAFSRIKIVCADFIHMPPPDPDNQADLILSTAVLEHVQDPYAILVRAFEWLRPGGMTWHMVDLRDHNLSFRYPFEMLTFSEKTWLNWFDLSGGFHLNRWRVHDYVAAAHRAGFVDVQYQSWVEDMSGLQRILPRLHATYRAIPPEQLAVLGIYLYGKRPD